MKNLSFLSALIKADRCEKARGQRCADLIFKLKGVISSAILLRLA